MKKNLLAISLVFAIGVVALPSASAQSCDIPAFVKDFVKNLRDECKKLEGPNATTSTCTKKQAALLKLVENPAMTLEQVQRDKLAAKEMAR